MKNSIQATIPFDFKGIHHTPSAVIDLDDLMNRSLNISNIYSIVATHNQVGLYSYEHEVLMASEIIFSNPEGFARQFFDAPDFDLEGFQRNYHQHKAMSSLRFIAEKHMGIDDLDANQPLKDALLEAFHQGQEKANQT